MYVTTPTDTLPIKGEYVVAANIPYYIPEKYPCTPYLVTATETHRTINTKEVAYASGSR